MTKIPLIIMGILIAIAIMMLIRNQLVYCHRTAALEIVSDISDSRIEKGDWFSLYDKYESYGSYTRQIFAFNKWTFDQFYPNLMEEKNVKDIEENEGL